MKALSQAEKGRVMRALVLLLVGLLLGACGVYTAPAPVAPVAPTHINGAAALRSKTVALVQIKPDADLRPYCSGVWVSGTSILTARHCVDDAAVGDVELYVVHGDVYPSGPAESKSVKPRGAHLYAFDEAHDLALLRADVPPSGHGVAYTRIAPVEQGMFAQAMGHSLGLWYSYSSGDVAAIRERNFGDGNRLWLQTTTPISPGNSGGGLFDVDASLIGICHGSFTRGQGLNLFVHAHYIDELLAAASKAGTL